MNNNEVKETYCSVPETTICSAVNDCKETKCIDKQLLQLKAEHKQLTQKLEKAREALENFDNLTGYLYRIDFLNTKMEVVQHFSNIFTEFEDIAQQTLKELEE